MMKRTLFFSVAAVLLLAVVLLLAAGCSEDPNIVGLGVLPGQDSLHIGTLEIHPTSDTTYLSRVVGGSSTLLVGTYQSLNARTLISFSGISIIPAASILDSARITLRVNYRFKDSAGTAGIEAHRFLNGFTSTTFNWDSTVAAGAYSDTVAGSVLQTMTPLDSIISFRIDTAVIRQWIAADVGRLILLPTGNMVVGISPVAGDPRPLLSVYTNGNDTLPSKFKMLNGIFVADGTVPAIAGEITLQAGVAYRGILHFDSLVVPPRVSVTQAILEVPVDTASSLMNSQSDDNIIAHLLRKSYFPYDSLILGTKCTPAYNGLQKVYRADIKAIVQQWLLREPNNGLVIRASGELSTFDRFVVYGPGAAAALRPRITITYSVLP